MGIESPEEYGGGGMSFISSIIAIEEIAKVDPGVRFALSELFLSYFSVIVDIHNTLLNTAIRRWASEELKKEYLPRLATDTLGAFALSEAGSGSDAFAMTTTATKDGASIAF